MRDMLKATRLTGAGKLTEAALLLRRMLSDQAPRAAEPRRSQPTIDMVPPAAGEGAWTPPAAGAKVSPAFFSALSDQLGKPDALSRVKLPEAVQNLLGRLGGLEGLRGGIVAPAAQPLPPGARFEERLYADAGGERAYKLYVPSGYDGQPRPLVVMLHGCTQSPDDFAAGTNMNVLAEEQNVLVAYPAQSQSANASKCWNWFNVADQKRGGGEPALIAGITRQIMRDHAVDPDRVYVAGLSAGGAAAAIMGTTYPDLYAAIGVHSGLACGAARDMPSAFNAMRQGGAACGARGRSDAGGPVPTIVFHGDGDKTVNPVNGDHIIAQVRSALEPAAPSVTRGKAPGGLAYTRTVQADGNGGVDFEQWVVHGAGHAWSGGSTNGSYTEPRGPDASREMLRFFLNHARRPAASPVA